MSIESTQSSDEPKYLGSSHLPYEPPNEDALGLLVRSAATLFSLSTSITIVGLLFLFGLALLQSITNFSLSGTAWLILASLVFAMTAIVVFILARSHWNMVSLYRPPRHPKRHR